MYTYALIPFLDPAGKVRPSPRSLRRGAASSWAQFAASSASGTDSGWWWSWRWGRRRRCTRCRTGCSDILQKEERIKLFLLNLFPGFIYVINAANKSSAFFSLWKQWSPVVLLFSLSTVEALLLLLLLSWTLLPGWTTKRRTSSPPRAQNWTLEPRIWTILVVVVVSSVTYLITASS